VRCALRNLNDSTREAGTKTKNASKMLALLTSNHSISYLLVYSIDIAVSMKRWEFGSGEVSTMRPAGMSRPHTG
jgi:hypothetical protein